MKQISELFYNQDQSWHYEKIVRFGNFSRLKVYIRRNAYDNQSFVKGYVLKDSQWNLIVARPIETARCKETSYLGNSKGSICLFREDAGDVLDLLIEILGLTDTEF